MKEIKDIEKLFSESFENFEAPVKPELWSSISQGISSTGASATASVGVIAKTIIAASIVVSAVVVSYFVLSDSDSVLESTIETTATNPVDVKTDIEIVRNETIVENVANQNNKESKEVVKITATNLNEKSSAISTKVETEDVKGFKTDGDDLEKEIPVAQEKSTVLEQKTNNSNDEIVKHKKVEESIEQTKVGSVVKEQSVGRVDVVVENYNREVNDIVYPTVFTPNNDGANDFLELKIEQVSFFRIEVYSPKGELVYFSEDVNFKWDGYHLNGSPVPNGRYVYQVETRDLNGVSQKPKVQKLEIIR